MIAVGRSSVPYVDPFSPGRPLVLECYRAATHRAESPVVLVLHGMGRNGDEYCDAWVAGADRHGLLIVAPTFPDADWPGSRTYNDGHVRDAACEVRAREGWSNAIPARVFGMLRASGVTTRTQAFLWGHSAGAQFVHRLLALQPHGPFMAAGAGNAGWYTAPDLGRPYPEGLGGLGLGGEDVVRWLAFPLVIFAGDRDNDGAAQNLPSHPVALAQGPHRFARAHWFLAAGQREAARRGVPCHWRIVVVPGVGHEGMRMSAVAAAYWFDAVMPAAAAEERAAGVEP